MSVYKKGEINFPKTAFVKFKNINYIPDVIIYLPLEKDDVINLKNATCIFAVRNSYKPLDLLVVGADKLENLNNNNVSDKFYNCYPERILCFVNTKFPLDKFIKENDFKNQS